MNVRAVFHLMSYLLLMIGVGMAACWGVAFFFDDPFETQRAMALSGALTLFCGLILRRTTKLEEEEELSRRDGLGVVTLGWIAASLFGALPYLLSGVIPRAIPAVFETMSGFTTTGASVLQDQELLPRGILFWRALTHFFGGMGVLVLCVAILPFLGVGGMQLYRAEMPGPAKDRLTPRIASTAKLLWGVYVGLCALEAALLRVGGMSWFDALCHSFATMATGGFSTRSASIGAYHSVYIESVIVVFMFLAGTNFALHYRALRGNLAGFFRDPEFRCYAAVWALATLLVTLNIWKGTYPHLGQAFRAGVFQVTSIMTTTGFTTENFDAWPTTSRLLLLVLMGIGASAGSTGGGMKVIRLFVLLKAAAREIRLFMRPQAVFQVKLGREGLEPAIVSNITAFVMLFLLLFLLATFLMSFFVPDLTTAASAVVATLGNIGPGMGLVGPLFNYAAIPPAGQFILILCMLLGRLEIYTVLVLFFPAFWKK